MDFHYTVKGSWPFPVDMLRRDMSKAATPDDQAIIDRLSKPYAEDRDAIRNAVTINLVIPDAGRWRPNTARWKSFGWVGNERVFCDDPRLPNAIQEALDKAAASAIERQEADNG